MLLHFLGVRGSTPAPGLEFVRYGGHTSCVAVTLPGESVPTVVLDAGTGLRNLGTLLRGEPFRGSLLLGHLHWDHVQGIPFTRAVDDPTARVDVYLPAQSGASGKLLLEQQLSPPAFPITPAGLCGDWRFTAVEPGPFECEGARITAAEIAHKGGRTFAYRIDTSSGSIAYASDHAPADGVSEAALELFSGVDVLIHDAQFFESERALANLYAHATVDDAFALADRVSARQLVLFHHSPVRTDDALDRLVADLGGSAAVAREGDRLEVTRLGGSAAEQRPPGDVALAKQGVTRV